MDYSPNGTEEFYAYVIYEYDGWPALRKTVDVKFNGGQIGSFQFRFYNDAYSKEIFTTNPQDLVGTRFEGMPSSKGVKIENSTIGYRFNP